MAKPHKMADVMGELLARRGFGRVRTAEALQDAWQRAAGQLIGEHSRIGNLRRGVLEVLVVNSTLLQELTFRKAELLQGLAAEVPDGRIKDLRFRLAPVTS